MPLPIRLLITEDNEDDVLLLRRTLAKCATGFDPHFLRDGPQTINYLAAQDTHRPAVLLLDIKMPGMSGFDVLQWLKSNPTLRNLVVVMFSSSSHPGDVARAYELGANSYVVKPSSTEKLRELLLALEKFW